MNHVLTCKSDNIQGSATHVVGDVHFDDIRRAPIQLGKPDVSYFGSLLVEDWSERPELPRPERRILCRSSLSDYRGGVSESHIYRTMMRR